MRQIREIHEACLQEGRPAISFEFFPPRTAEGDRTLLEKTIPALMAAQPDYSSVTYGAGGSTKDKTLDIVDRIQKEHGLPCMMHLTCINATSEQLRAVVEEARSRGIVNFLALRGDPPDLTKDWTATEGGFEYSHQLVAFLRELDGFSIGTAAFPEGHIAQKGGKIVDWGFLKAKVEAGADFAITQLFFDNEDFFQFHRHVRQELGVKVPIIPGILPILSARQTKKFVTMCGARLPEPFLNRIEELGEDDAGVVDFGIEYALQQCRELLDFGVPGLHFYTLNKAHSTLRILEGLGLDQGPRR